MSLSVKDVREVAGLARLEFSDDELIVLTEQLGKIVSFVEQLSAVPTEGVEPLAHPLDVHSVTRTDQLATSLPREAALSNSPSHDQTYFLVPPVMAKKH